MVFLARNPDPPEAPAVLPCRLPPCSRPVPLRSALRCTAPASHPRTLAPLLPPFAFAPSRRPASFRPISHLLPPPRPRVKPAASLAPPSLRPASPRCPPRASHPLAPTFPSRPPRSSRSRSLAPTFSSRPSPPSVPPPNIPHTFDDFATRRRPSCPSPTGGRPHFPRWASVAALPAAGEGLSDARPGCLCVAKSSKVCRSSVRPRRPRQSRRLRRMVVPSTMRGNEQGVDFCS